MQNNLGGPAAALVSVAQMDRRGRRRFFLVLVLLILALIVLIGLNIGLGSVAASRQEIWEALRYPQPSSELSPEVTMMRDILWKIRLPRLVGVLLLGGALALSGFLMQTFFHNPLAGPYILGISSGAKLFVALLLVFLLSQQNLRLSSFGMIVAAFAGSMMCMGFILLVSRHVDNASILVVAGVMLGYICSAITEIVITFADDASLVNLHNWSKGSFSGISWDHIKVMFWPIVICTIAVFFLAKPLAAYRLGEGYARSVGVNLRVLRLALVLLSSFLSACVTAFAGPISFVGIAVPHLVKASLQSSRPLYVMPVCFLGGSIFCLACDLIARTAFSPLELSVGAVTAIFGAPIVIYVLLKRGKNGSATR